MRIIRYFSHCSVVKLATSTSHLSFAGLARSLSFIVDLSQRLAITFFSSVGHPVRPHSGRAIAIRLATFVWMKLDGVGDAQFLPQV